MRGDGGQVARVGKEWGWGKKGLGWMVGLIEKIGMEVWGACFCLLYYELWIIGIYYFAIY